MKKGDKMTDVLLKEATDEQLLDEMQKRYEMCAAEIQKLQQEIDMKTKASMGFKKALQEAGRIEKPAVGKRGRKPKEVVGLGGEGVIALNPQE
jgi:uncharacterized protein YlxW (UPF0749 family)